MVCQSNQKSIPFFLFTGARDPMAALYCLCLVIFNLDDSWNKDGFMLTSSSITVYYSELRKAAHTFKWHYSFLSCLKLRLPFHIIKTNNSVHQKTPLKERKGKPQSGKLVFAKHICKTHLKFIKNFCKSVRKRQPKRLKYLHFTKEPGQLPNEHIKWYFTSSVIRNMQIKLTMKYYYPSTRKTKSKVLVSLWNNWNSQTLRMGK